MTTFPRFSTTAIGQNKNAPRVWLEGRYLRDAGFVPGCHIAVEFTTNKIIIKLAANGPRVVSSKRQGQIPVVDLNSSAIQTTFGTSVAKLQVHVSPNQITLTPAHSLALRASRCKNGTEGSCFSGGGLLTEAAKQAGYTPTFAIEIDPGYASIFEANHPEARMFNLSVEDVPLDALPQVELLSLGIPCQPWSRSRTLDRQTGNKRDRSLPAEAHPLSDLTVWSAILINHVNPATIVIEEAPDYLNSSAGYMLRLFLDRAGYFVHGAVLDPTLYGEITGRKRTVIVATSEPGFQWPAASPCTKTFADFADSPEIAESQYFTPEQKPWLFNHWKTQTERGNGFEPPKLSDQSTRVPVIKLRYFAGQGDGVVVKHPTREAYRWLSLAEVRRIHAVPDNYLLDEEQSVTRAGEVIGQGVIVSFFQKIISAARNFTRNDNTQTTAHQQLSQPKELASNSDAPTALPFELNQMGLAFS
jgi:DNA (cytosine-5)-methyltransferase 1